MAKHRIECVRPLCHCLRVTHPHRPGSYPLCEFRPFSDLLKAALEGASEEQLQDIAMEIVLTTKFKGKATATCPF